MKTREDNTVCVQSQTSSIAPTMSTIYIVVMVSHDHLGRITLHLGHVINIHFRAINTITGTMIFM